MVRTIITVTRPDGTTEEIVKQGQAITSPSLRAKMVDATRDAGRGDILSFVVVGQPAPFRPRRGGVSDGSRDRCRACGRIGDDGECGLGNP